MCFYPMRFKIISILFILIALGSSARGNSDLVPNQFHGHSLVTLNESIQSQISNNNSKAIFIQYFMELGEEEEEDQFRFLTEYQPHSIFTCPQPFLLFQVDGSNAVFNLAFQKDLLSKSKLFLLFGVLII